jgi:hypothetical protein
MQSLFSLASSTDLRPVALPARGVVHLQALHIAFPRATPDRLPEGKLPPTYTSKALVSVNGDAMFGELAIMRWLERDGWEGVWVDTSHGGKFWKAMPHKSSPVRLPPAARATFDAIRRANGGKGSGAFDVMAWRGGDFAFFEYKGEDEAPNRNEARWIDAALDTGILPTQLRFVVHPANS